MATSVTCAVDPRRTTTHLSAGHRKQLAVLEGALTVLIGGTSETLNTGDAMFFQADVDHGFANRTNAPSEYIMVISSRS
ncbi:cupin domain-containing protein [Nocardia sp. 2]|uniref:Cupin domain-containing protein n=1 Tax=Nocardia acididurans TaxID=2802282 RepID=A0ABS1MGC6_9NOCA|nr:cupin domain-containing protein [Nocardia acididurans]MBL1079667.1 cupin domain-containing protein [Nocardia acididurans]